MRSMHLCKCVCAKTFWHIEISVYASNMLKLSKFIVWHWINAHTQGIWSAYTHTKTNTNTWILERCHSTKEESENHDKTKLLFACWMLGATSKLGDHLMLSTNRNFHTCPTRLLCQHTHTHICKWLGNTNMQSHKHRLIQFHLDSSLI